MEGVALHLLEHALRGNGATHNGGQTFAQIFAPVREESRQSGMTEEELRGLIEEARIEIWQEKQAQKGS